MNKLSRTSLIGLYSIIACGIICIVFDSSLVDFALREPFYGYSILIGFLCLFLTWLIIFKSKTFPPSIVLFLSFLIAPFIGPLGNRVYEKLYGLFHSTQLIFAYPTFVWAVGTTALLLGILFSYYFIRIKNFKFVVKWNLELATLLMWFTIAVSLFFSLYALYKIGYIPILSSNLGELRAGYEAIVGDYPLKLSRLWLVAASLASILAFMKKPSKLYFFTILISLLGLMIYGQRIYVFMAIVSFVLVYCKFCKLKLIFLAPVVVLITVVFILYAEYRAGRSSNELSVPELVALQLLGEWREYCLVVNELKESRDFYHEEIFLSGFAPLLPKQIWAAFGIDKHRLIQEYSAVFIFGRKFNNPILGIRLGTIGEAYAGYGIFYGVCLQMFLFGVIFGLLEKVYLKLRKEDARLCLICFLISLFMYLPIATLYITVAHAIFFGFFFMVYQFIASYRVRGAELEKSFE